MAVNWNKLYEANRDDWARTDNYHNSFLIPDDPILDTVLKHSKDNDLPDIAVSKSQGRFMNLLVKTMNAKKILEVGTLGGYSTILMARALPKDGKLITLELSEKHAKVAGENIQTAGLADKVEIKVGSAVETIKALSPLPQPFDLVFIDANKSDSVTYFVEAKRLVRSGGVIIVDNVIFGGMVSDLNTAGDPTMDGLRALLHHIKGDKDVEATTIGTVNEKGYDGFLYAVKL